MQSCYFAQFVVLGFFFLGNCGEMQNLKNAIGIVKAIFTTKGTIQWSLRRKLRDHRILWIFFSLGTFPFGEKGF